MSLTRREFLERCAALGVTVAVLPTLGCDPKGGGLAEDGFPLYTWDGPLGPATTFAHGVASGDPLADSVLLWTHVATDTTDDVDVFVEVSKDSSFEDRVAVSTFVAAASAGHTLKLDQMELEAGTTYYYRFSALGRTSSVGRTRTLSQGAVDRLRIAVCSCSNYAFGYFHGYRHMAQRADLDFWIHLGDYFYEHSSVGEGFYYGAFRELDPPNEILTLSDYRRRYAWYHTDPDLQELHRQHPMVHCWDDHEFADNPKVGGAVNHDPDTEGSWDDRVAAALQAYSEWIPTRLDGNRIYREFILGDLAHIVFTDRQRRYLWPESNDAELYLGSEQTAWLQERLATVTAPWLLLCTGTSFTSREAEGAAGGLFDGNPWDPTSRRTVLDAVADAGIENLVVLIGDIHKSQALDVAHDPSTYVADTGAGSEGVEFACGSITSPGLGSLDDPPPQLLWSAADKRTYLLLDITPERLQGEFWGIADALKFEVPLPTEELVKAYTCAAGSHHLVETAVPTVARTDVPAFAP